MTKREIFDLGLDISSFLNLALEAENTDSAEVANCAVDMVKGILLRSPKLRYEVWRQGKQELLDLMGLDYGAET